MQRVELHQAFVWRCLHCFDENFARCESINIDDLPEDEKLEVCERFDIEPHHEGFVVTAPKIVSCKECGEAFSTEDVD